MVPIMYYERALNMMDSLFLILAREGEGEGIEKEKWRVEFMNKALKKHMGVEDVKEINIDGFVVHSSYAQHNNSENNQSNNKHGSFSGTIVLRAKDGNGM